MTKTGSLGRVGILVALFAIGACSNGRGSLGESAEQQEPTTVTIGGTVTGLEGSGLVLQNNGGDDLTITSNGNFMFATPLDPGATYNVTVLTRPSNPSQTCAVNNATGTAGTTNVTSVAVVCGSGTYRIGGTVSGLAGSGLVLRNNGEDDLPIASNGAFTFATELETGATYEVTVASQPTEPSQTCTVANGAGTVLAADVRSIAVTCSTNTYTVSGVVSGLEGKGLVLQNNGGDDVAVQTDGTFTFPTALASGSTYNVTVRTQPSEPTQACTVQAGSGAIADAPVSDVVVTCATRAFTIGGTVSGYAGSGLVLHNNGGDALTLTENGTFTFPTAVLSGETYNVTVATQPTGPAQACTVTNASGTVGSSNVNDVSVSCVTLGFRLRGSVSGLAGSGLVLRNSGVTLPIAANGAFAFPDSYPEGTPYNVTVAVQPVNPTQVCTVSNGSGAIGTSDVTNIGVQCVTSRFTVGGTVTGLVSFGLRLRINGSETINVPRNGSFTFPTPIPSGSTYSVEVAANPVFPVSQTCTIVNGTGTGIVGGSNVTSVAVTCR
ncbi:MAG TPA: hypothetical protein VF161_11220 [Steroidobacteraceae bacterium]